MIDTIEAMKSTLPEKRWYLAIIIELIFYTLMVLRPYAIEPFHCTTLHYYGFLIVTDAAAPFLKERYRHWYFIFCAVSSIHLLQVTVYLWATGTDGGVAWVSGLRIIFGILRLCHAVDIINKYGPWLSHVEAFYSFAKAIYKATPEKHKPILKTLATEVVIIFLLPLIYYSHWNYGESTVDAPLVAMQAGFVVTMRLKLLVFNLLIATPRTRALAMLPYIIFTFFSWTAMPRLFFNAPLTFFPHAFFDVSLVRMWFETYFEKDGPGAPFEHEDVYTKDGNSETSSVKLKRKLSDADGMMMG